MIQQQSVMGMPITIEILDINPNSKEDIDNAFRLFIKIDNIFSPFKDDSEVTLINKKLIKQKNYSSLMQEVLNLCDTYKKNTSGFFNPLFKNNFDPSGLVKGWAVSKVSQLISSLGYVNYYIDASGDIVASGLNRAKKKWSVGIKNPFDQQNITKIVRLTNMSIATSGNYYKGDHIYNPVDNLKSPLVSISVIGQNVIDTDVYATASYAMGLKGLDFIEKRTNCHAYAIDYNKNIYQTSGFKKYLK